MALYSATHYSYEVEVENLHQESIAAQRIVYYYINVVGGILKVSLTPALLAFAANSRQRYLKVI